MLKLATARLESPNSEALTSRRLWSLWDMLEFYAGEFVSLCESLGAARMAMQQHAINKREIAEAHEIELPNGLWPLKHLEKKFIATRKDWAEANERTRLGLEETLRFIFKDTILREMDRIGLVFSLVEAKRLQARISSKIETITPQDIEQLSKRIADELGIYTFFQLDPRQAKFYEPSEPLFGADVEAKFPMMSEDIAEAGNCMALDRDTAAVFHLMRVMEIALQRLGDKLGIVFVDKKNWQNILEEVNKAIRALDQKDPQTKTYAEISAHLCNVKLCWRNEVMHPKQTYTEEEAGTLFSAVKTFIRDLASVL